MSVCSGLFLIFNFINNVTVQNDFCEFDTWRLFLHSSAESYMFLWHEIYLHRLFVDSGKLIHIKMTKNIKILNSYLFRDQMTQWLLHS